MSVRIGLGFAVFPFSDAAAFWRWIDACEECGVDSAWAERATVLPLRDPLVLAKECATVDYLSDGRLLPMFGVGNDAAPEWKALGMETKGRGAPSNEMLTLLNRLWKEDHVSFDGSD